MFQNRVLHIREGNYQLNSAVDILVKISGLFSTQDESRSFRFPSRPLRILFTVRPAQKGLVLKTIRRP
jgi:hypothetical protein